MEQKHIAIIVAAIVVLAAVGGGVALLSKPDNKSNETQIPDPSGKWNLMYTESAVMYDSANNEVIMDVNNIEITDHLCNPNDNPAVLDVASLYDHGFKGSFNYEKERTIYGTVNANHIKFSFKEGPATFVFQGAAKGEGYLSGSLIKYIDITKDDVEYRIVAGVTYMMFIHDGSDPVSLRSDYFDMSIMEYGRHIKSVLHDVTDFDEGKSGAGREVGSKLVFGRDHNMISLFTVLGDGDNVIGVQAVVSMGVTPIGNVSANIAGNLISPSDPQQHWTLAGHMSIAQGKATILHFLYHDSMGLKPQFVEIEYNAYYPYGETLAPGFISKNCEYKGTVVVDKKDQDPSKYETTIKFKIMDNTFCSTVVNGDFKYTMFGEVYGQLVVVYLLNSDLNEVGRLTGHIVNGEIHVYGTTHDLNDGDSSFIEITLKPVKT